MGEVPPIDDLTKTPGYIFWNTIAPMIFVMMFLMIMISMVRALIR